MQPSLALHFDPASTFQELYHQAWLKQIVLTVWFLAVSMHPRQNLPIQGRHSKCTYYIRNVLLLFLK